MFIKYERNQDEAQRFFDLEIARFEEEERIKAANAIKALETKGVSYCTAKEVCDLLMLLDGLHSEVEKLLGTGNMALDEEILPAIHDQVLDAYKCLVGFIVPEHEN